MSEAHRAQNVKGPQLKQPQGLSMLAPRKIRLLEGEKLPLHVYFRPDRVKACSDSSQNTAEHPHRCS